MPRFEAFAGLRYDSSIAPLQHVIAPPYDVVDDKERALLAQRSQYNAILVELPEPDQVRGLDRYANAAALFSAWQGAGALVRDGAPSLYVYVMRFVDEFGDARETTGVIGALGVDVAGGSEVLPHEQTMPKPKGDRLDLLRACRANLSPIWGLSLRAGLAQACAHAASSARVVQSALDDDGVAHELYVIEDPAAIEAIAGLVTSTPIVIADGHHRYETARYYQEEQRAAHGDAPASHDLVMAFVAELSEEQLFVQAIHRLLNGLPAGIDLAGSFEPFFEISPGPSDPAALATAMREVGALALIESSQVLLLAPRKRLLEEASADLDSSRLDVALAALGEHEVTYQHGVSNIFSAVHEGRAQAGVLLRPATVSQIAETAHRGTRMPPKTTYFHPKPRTGMVFRSLD